MSSAQAIIAAMITPALLVLAAGSLIATALVRLARVVDRVRKLAELPSAQRSDADLQRNLRRAILAERAVAWFFAAIVLFVIAGATIGLDQVLSDRLRWLPVLLTVGGMVLIVAGSAAMLIECRLGSEQIRCEISRISQPLA